MSREAAISSGRLAAYLAVFAIHRAKGLPVTSDQLHNETGVNPTQIRRDLSSLGKNGKRGTGYDCDRMIRTIRTAYAERGVVVQGGAAILAGHVAGYTHRMADAGEVSEASLLFMLGDSVGQAAVALRHVDFLIEQLTRPS